MISLFLSLVAFAAAANVLKPSGTIDVSLDLDSPRCPIEVEVTAAQAGPGCHIQFHTPTTAGGKLTYWFGNTTTFTDSNKLEYAPETDEEVVLAPCPTAGKYYLGVQIKDCVTCMLGKNLDVTISATLFDEPSATFTLDVGKSLFRTGNVFLNEKDSVNVNFEIENPGSVAHFDVDKCTLCRTDNYEYSYATAGATGNGTEVSSSGTENKIEIPDLAPGNYVLKIHLEKVVTGSQSTFDLAFNVNAEAGDAETVKTEARCAQADCTLASMTDCDDCVDANCNWCGTSCQIEETCASALIKTEDACEAASSSSTVVASVAMTVVGVIAAIF